MKNLFKTLFCIFAITLFFSSTLFAQSKIYGNVKDGNEPLIGQTILIKGTNLGTATDENGYFEITNIADGRYVLVFSGQYFSDTEKEVIVNGDTSFDFDVNEMYTVKFDDVIVSATRATDKTPVTFTNIDKETLEAYNLGQDVPFLLKWTPSTVVTSDAGTGIGYTGIRIRGSDPSRINVTINGIPLNDSESQGVFWVDLPDFISSTNDIQIQRGVGTSTNGAGAFGATINLNTNKLHKEAYAQVANTIGSFNTWKRNITLGSGLLHNRFTLDGRYSSISSHGFIDRGSSDTDSYYFSGAYLGDRTSIRMNVFSGHEVTYQAWNGVPAQFVPFDDLRTFNTAGTEKAGEPHENEVDDYRQTHYQLHLNQTITDNINISGALHYTKGEGFFEQYKAGQDLVDYGFENVMLGDTTITSTDLIRRRWLDNDFYGVTYALNSTNTNFDLTVGGAWNRYEGKHFGEVIWAEFMSNGELGDRYYDNDAEKTDFNIFAKTILKLNSNVFPYLDLQYRRVDYTFLGLNAAGENVDQDVELNFFNPKIGLTVEFDNNAQTYASIAVANREPNRSDFTESSPTSRPEHETLYNAELGYRKASGKFSYAINGYYMLYDNQLVVTGQINDVGEYTRVNVPDSYRAGIELEGAVELMSGLVFHGNATFSRNRIQSFTEYIDNWDTGEQEIVQHEDTDLALSPNVIATGGLTYDVFKKGDKNQLSFTLSGKYVGSQFIDNTSNENTMLDSYFFSDLRIGYTLKTDWISEIGITLLARNIFDARFSNNAWTYRYRSTWDGREFDPYTQLEDNATSTYNLTGFYPQAGRNFLLGISLKF